MNEEFYIETLENIKEYMQNSIDKGYHKFIYNDLDWDVKCIDVISAIDMLINKNNELKKYYQCERNLLDNYVSKDRIKEKIEGKIAYCRAEELEDSYIGDKHSQYWRMYRELLEKLEQELLVEGDK